MNQKSTLKPPYQRSFPIQGMHCASCELLITDELESLKGVTSAEVSLNDKGATVYSDRPVAFAEIQHAVQAAGYEVGIEDDTKPIVTRNRRIWKDFVVGVAAVLGAYVLFKMLGIDTLASSTSATGSTAGMALLVGLTAGFSTCMALIGGLVLGISSKYAENHPTESAAQKFSPHIFFNLGRIVSFAGLGAVIGVIGSAFALRGTMLGFLTLVVGLVMLVLGLQLTEVFPRLTRGVTLPGRLAKSLGLTSRKNREYSHTNAFLMGGATFFLPCGFTQAMQLLAISTGSPIQAAVIMAAFAIGTTPGLLSLGGLTSIVKGAFAQRFFRVIGVAVVAMALVNFSNGFNLIGLNRMLKGTLPIARTNTSSQPVDDAVILKTTFKLTEDIVPRVFTAKVGQKTSLVVDVKENGQGCMSTIMIIGLDDKPQYLKAGSKVELTFTAEKPGIYTIACAMGVPRGSITVTD